MQKYIESFIEIGFSQQEATVYISILKNGKSFISDITKDIGYKRSSVINYVEELLERGVVSKLIIGKRLAYTAEKPDLILKNFIAKKQKFEKNIPELNNLFFNSNKQAKVRYFEGIKGIQNIYLEVTSQFKTIYTFASLDKIIETVGIKGMDLFKSERIKNGTKVRDLLEDTEISRDYVKMRGPATGSKNKWLPKNFPLKIDLLIWGDSIAMISFENKMGVIIENKDMADFHRNMHNYVWRTIKD